MKGIIMPATLQAGCGIKVDHTWEMYELTRDAHYRNLLVGHYHYLVSITAEQLRRRLPGAVEIDDLISAGGFGLMNAVETFDRTRAVKFETYCVHRIRGAILDELRRTDWVPRSARSRAQEFSGAVECLEARLGRRPCDSEIARELDLDSEEFDRLQHGAMAPRMTSLDEIRHGGPESDGMRQLDVLATQKASEPSSRVRRRELIREITHGLSRTEKLIIVLYHCEELTMKEIGLTLGLSESRVSQLHSVLLARLRARVSRRAAGSSVSDLAV